MVYNTCYIMGALNYDLGDVDVFKLCFRKLYLNFVYEKLANMIY